METQKEEKAVFVFRGEDQSDNPKTNLITVREVEKLTINEVDLLPLTRNISYTIDGPYTWLTVELFVDRNEGLLYYGPARFPNKERFQIFYSIPSNCIMDEEVEIEEWELVTDGVFVEKVTFRSLFKEDK